MKADPNLDLPHLEKRFPKIEYHEMPGTGHFLMLEKPAEFNRLLKSFLDKAPYYARDKART
jgi:pimeloyl-ACP methyl ester carboxylesterase